MADIDESYREYLQSLQDPGPFMLEAAAGPEDGGADEEEDDEDETEDDQDGVEYIGSQTVDVADDDEDATVSAQARLGEEEEPRDERLGEVVGGGEACSPGGFGAGGADSEASQSKRGEIDGLFCPICMEAWTDDGGHQMCCLPCGHIYGMSCIKRWLKQRGNSGKCPQCNNKCKLKDVRKLFASRLVTVDEESQKKIRFLEAKCASLEKKVAGWHMKEVEWKRQVKKWRKHVNEFERRESQLNERLDRLKERETDLERFHEVLNRGQFGSAEAVAIWQGRSTSGHEWGSRFPGGESSSNFGTQTELRVDGARLFDICASSQMLIIARRLSGIGIRDALTKMSLIYPHETEDIILPSRIKAVRDLHISPFDRSLAVFASLGKTLSVLSLESNNIILAYDLPAAAWSCSWDLNNAHHVYAGLQNGMLLVFDMRQTLKPMKSLEGLSCNPIHSIYSLLHKETHGARTILSASSIGLCLWKVDSSEGRPTLVSESADGGVCISLAYCPSSDDVVATYRPKVEMSKEVTTSQPLSTPSSSPVGGQAIRGYHVHFRRAGSSYQKLGTTGANVSDVRLPRSAIVDLENRNRLFASGDEATNQLILQELPSFSVSQQLKLKKHPFRDVKYMSAMNQGLLSCLSEDSLQIFKAMPA
ncbi:E3 ubiquitin-protein ligase RFWD3 isoform X2 [Rhodamnia argentea]|uniref:RING-type E3 ubiquitin transferase n=1 Tax=Rhodamnia argentea TaxID=178133 RepID=A0A8B8NJ45_9MYRT|nr:E3 ubiquitin-protein ligase RFWD3 isoform X2 [Rhodamnia argentea]